MQGADSAKMQARKVLAVLFCALPAIRNRVRRRGGPVRRILVIRPDHLGDLLFATPSAALLRRAFPNAHITGAVGPWGRVMWEGNPNIDALEIVPFTGIVEAGRGLEPYKLLARAARRLGAGSYDLGIVLRADHWWGAALMWAAGIPKRWGYDTPGMNAWLTNSVLYTPGLHEVEQNLRLTEAVVGHTEHSDISLKINRRQGEPRLRPPCALPPNEEVQRAFVGAKGEQQEKRAIIHPGTAGANKLWTISGWAEVADRLAEKGWSVALTGSPDEQELCARIAGASKSKPLDLAGRTANVGQLVWLMERADLVLGVDSGPLHIADALGKPTLHLYGPSDEAAWGPWGDPDLHRALRAPNTRPTMQLGVALRQQEGGPQMRAITPAMVMSEIAKLTGRC